MPHGVTWSRDQCCPTVPKDIPTAVEKPKPASVIKVGRPVDLATDVSSCRFPLHRVEQRVLRNWRAHYLRRGRSGDD